MCGRARCTLAPAAVQGATGIPPERWQGAEQWQPVENAAPGMHVLAVCAEPDSDVSKTATVHVPRWGLIPFFTNKAEEKPDFFRMFNARSESVTTSSAYRHLIKSKRCIVLLDGFYEWKAEAGGKQPYYVYSNEQPVLQVAGLWDTWYSNEGPVETCTLLTTNSCPRLKWLHDRMPALLMTPEARQRWLQQGDITAAEVARLCAPYNGEDLVWHPVTCAMNKMRYQGADCAKELKKQSISAFFKPKTTPNAKPTANSPDSKPAQLATPTATPSQHAAGSAVVKSEQRDMAAGSASQAAAVQIKQEGSAPQEVYVTSEPQTQADSAHGKRKRSVECSSSDGALGQSPASNIVDAEALNADQTPVEVAPAVAGAVKQEAAAAAQAQAAGAKRHKAAGTPGKAAGKQIKGQAKLYAFLKKG